METITKGTSAKYSLDAGDFDPSSDSAEFIVRQGTNVHTFDMEADPDNESAFLADLAPADTTSITGRGEHCWFFRVTSGGDVTILDQGRIWVAPDPADAADDRTQFEQDLEALDAAIRAKISGGAVREYEIHTQVGRRLRHHGQPQHEDRQRHGIGDNGAWLV